jgi:ribosomal protein S26
MPRDKAIKAFRSWFETQMADRSKPTNQVRSEMGKLYKLYRKHGKLNLWCWCAPKACHTEIVKAVLVKAIEAAKKNDPTL